MVKKKNEWEPLRRVSEWSSKIWRLQDRYIPNGIFLGSLCFSFGKKVVSSSQHLQVAADAGWRSIRILNNTEYSWANINSLKWVESLLDPWSAWSQFIWAISCDYSWLSWPCYMVGNEQICFIIHFLRSINHWGIRSLVQLRVMILSMWAASPEEPLCRVTTASLKPSPEQNPGLGLPSLLSPIERLESREQLSPA